MITNDQATLLHDRATRGVSLTSDERQALNEWYVAQDAGELSSVSASAVDDSASVMLRSAVAAAAARVRLAGDRIHALSLENAKLRHEIEALQQQLSRQMTVRPA